MLVAWSVVACQSNTRDSDVPPPLESAAGTSGGGPASLPGESTVNAGVAVPPAPKTTLSKDAPSQRVSECSPCRFVAGQDVVFDVSFKAGAEQSVERLEVRGRAETRSQSSVAQTFALKDAWSPTGEFLLQAIDINFDGVLDFAFGPILGTPNLELQYWTVDAGTSQWTDVGRLSNLKVRTDTRELETSEKGGHAGLLFRNDVYRWAGGRLEHVRAVEQTEGTGVNQYRKTTRLFKDGKVVSESSEDVKAPQR
jgi:hypothetical protein